MRGFRTILNDLDAQVSVKDKSNIDKDRMVREVSKLKKTLFNDVMWETFRKGREVHQKREHNVFALLMPGSIDHGGTIY